MSQGAMLRVPSRPVSWFDRFRIRQCVGAARLPCGCETGRYLSYADELIEIIERHAPSCEHLQHDVEVIVTAGVEPTRQPH